MAQKKGRIKRSSIQTPKLLQNKKGLEKEALKSSASKRRASKKRRQLEKVIKK